MMYLATITVSGISYWVNNFLMQAYAADVNVDKAVGGIVGIFTATAKYAGMCLIGVAIGKLIESKALDEPQGLSRNIGFALGGFVMIMLKTILNGVFTAAGLSITISNAF